MVPFIMRQNLAQGLVPSTILLNGVAQVDETQSVVGEVYWRFDDDDTMDPEPLGEAVAGHSLIVPFNLDGRDIRLFLRSKSERGEPDRGAIKEAVQETFPFPSIRPPGTATYEAIASESLVAGNMVSFHLDSSILKVRKADASDDTKLCDGFVADNYSIGATATIITSAGTEVTGLSGLTIGTEYFLSETAGAITDTAPTTSGAIIQRIGKALSATTLLLRLQVIAEIE